MVRSQLVALLTWVTLALIAVVLAARAGRGLDGRTEVRYVAAPVLVLLAVEPMAR